MRNSFMRGHPRRVLAGVAAFLVCSFAAAACDVPQNAALPVPTTVVPPGAEARVHPAPSGLVLPESQPVRIRIPAIDVDSALIELGLQPDGTMEVPADGTVAGWYTRAPAPGQRGPAVIAAHVDWDGEPGVFYDLDELRPGDEVSVQRRDGATALFRIDRVEQYPKTDFPTDAVYGDIDHAGLRLITCGGAFDDQAHSYEDNIVAYARLVAAT